jgi:hypothetical protein
MRMAFVMKMFFKSFKIVQIQASQECILCVHSLLLVSQRYTLVDKNKIRARQKIMPMKKPKPLLTINVNDATDSTFKKLK